MQHDLVDVAPSLSDWIGSVLPAIDDSLARIGDGDWKPGTREVVLQAVADELIAWFIDGIGGDGSVAELERQATRHLADYVICQSRATVLRARA